MPEVMVFIERFIPSLDYIIYFIPVSLIYGILAGSISTWLKTRRKWKTAYTRKVFHILIFSFAGILQAIYGIQAVVVLGSTICVIVLYAVYRGSGFGFYEALARPSDKPQRSLFILIPMVTTAIGGLLANVFFLNFAIIGYLAGGFGDAAGEPVGAKFGKHKYKVLSLAGVPAVRSFEGSLGVFIASLFATWAGFLILNTSLLEGFIYALLTSVVVVITEAVSSHGLDNLTIQVAAAGTAYLLMR